MAATLALIAALFFALAATLEQKGTLPCRRARQLPRTRGRRSRSGPGPDRRAHRDVV